MPPKTSAEDFQSSPNASPVSPPSDIAGDPFTPEENAALTHLVEIAHEKLETAIQSSTSRAFNLGCWVGLAPVAIIVLSAFFITKGSWVAAAITLLLMMIALMGFANLVAYVARANTVRRTYQNEILPEIEHALEELHLPRSSFDRVADEVLPSGAELRYNLSLPTDKENTPEEEL